MRPKLEDVAAGSLWDALPKEVQAELAPQLSEAQEREAKAAEALLVEVDPDGGEDPDHGF